ncbi:MAG: hypothetical protein IJZ79_01945 [Bacilli bacterium]|nr:hypothetical protein [Bacilli bacterium]
MTIQELYENELVYWTQANQKFFGISPINEEDDFSAIQASLDADCKKYWNTEKPCKLAINFNTGYLNAEAHKQTPNSYKLKLNFHNMCVDIYGDYNGKSYLIAAIPTPSADLCWIINRSHYVPRVTAVKDYYSCVNKKDFETVQGEGWNYDISKNEFTCIITKDEYKFEPTLDEIYENHLSKRSRLLLEAVLGETLTKENFTKALRKLTPFDSESIYNYKFSRLEYFEEAVLSSKRYAQPTKNIILGINTIIAGKSKNYNELGEKLEGCLVRSESKIFALENFRTCVNVYNSGGSYQPAFTYKDTNGFFDSFKTVTSKAAGRQRLLLDNVVVKDGLLWIIEDDGSMHNMYEYLNMPQSKRLSCLSESPFCNNDKPKRIMMNAKMTSQAVSLKDEIDDITHRINARVGFTDIEGYTSADSIVISESFAKKLRTYDSTILYLNKKSKLFLALMEEYENGNCLDVNTLQLVFPTKNFAILLGYENARITKIDDVDVNNVRVFISWEIPFRLGDKITNLHGAKGTVGLILPDDKMPRLTKKVGKMAAGPLEIIISGFSTMRRGSLGQIFEAWARASEIDFDGQDYISIMIEKYKKQMETYSKNSIVEYDGVKTVIPVGINHIMRLYHHASTKVSCSSAEYGYTRTLRFGEMEKLNLVANDCPHILKELGIRSITKYVGSHKLVDDIQNTRTLPKNPKMSMQFIEILKSVGYSLTIEDDEQITDIDMTDEPNMDYVDEYNFNSIVKKEKNNNESDN